MQRKKSTFSGDPSELSHPPAAIHTTSTTLICPGETASPGYQCLHVLWEERPLHCKLPPSPGKQCGSSVTRETQVTRVSMPLKTVPFPCPRIALMTVLLTFFLEPLCPLVTFITFPSPSSLLQSPTSMIHWQPESTVPLLTLKSCLQLGTGLPQRTESSFNGFWGLPISTVALLATIAKMAAPLTALSEPFILLDS